jgi:hypothetical protein
MGERIYRLDDRTLARGLRGCGLIRRWQLLGDSSVVISMVHVRCNTGVRLITASRCRVDIRRHEPGMPEDPGDSNRNRPAYDGFHHLMSPSGRSWPA